MTDYFDPDKLLADVRARARAASERGDRALARLGGGSATRPRSPTYLTDGLTAEEIERDTASIHRILAVWKRIGLRAQSTIRLPSGKVLEPKSKRPSGSLEYAVTRPRKRRGARP